MALQRLESPGCCRGLRWLVVLAVVLIQVAGIGVRKIAEGGVKLTTDGRIIQPEGEPLEDYELEEKYPEVWQFLHVGLTALQALQAGGVASGPLVGLQHSPRDVELDEAGRKGFFPMFLVLTVAEKGQEQTYEALVDWNTRKYKQPHIAVVEAHRLSKKGKGERLQVPLPEPPSWFEENERGLNSMMGVIFATLVVKMGRTLFSSVWGKWRKADNARDDSHVQAIKAGEEKVDGEPVPVATTGGSTSTRRRKGSAQRT